LKIWLHGLTDFGDAAVLMPVAAAILIWLLFSNLRCAWWWTVAVVVCVGLTAALKIDFYGCPPSPALHSPSGHTGFSVLVYGAIALVAAAQATGVGRVLAAAVGIGVVFSVAASRILLEIHTLPEIGMGLLIGGISLSLFARVYLQYPTKQVWPLFVAAVILIAMLHGHELRAEEVLHRITAYLRVHC
jgi:membrane-associated phospholipid phosphatase